MKTATLQFEAAELLALMWAVEMANDVCAGHPDGIECDLTEASQAVHQRLQSAWQAIRE